MKFNECEENNNDKFISINEKIKALEYDIIRTDELIMRETGSFYNKLTDLKRERSTHEYNLSKEKKIFFELKREKFDYDQEMEMSNEGCDDGY
jgi:hypothetical protein